MADDFKSDLEMDRKELIEIGIDPDEYPEEEGTSVFDVFKPGIKAGHASLMLIAKKLGIPVNPTKDNLKGFDEGGLSARPGFRSLGEAKGQVSKEELRKGIKLAAETLLPLYDSGVNVSNIINEYKKPEGKRDYDYINSELESAGGNAAIDILLGGMFTKFGRKALSNLSQDFLTLTAAGGVGTGLAVQKSGYAGGGSVIKKLIKEYGDDVIDEIVELFNVMPINQSNLEKRGLPFKEGGEFLRADTKEILTNRNAGSVNVKVDPTMEVMGGRPQASMKAGNLDVETVGSGKGSKIMVNLVKPTTKGNKAGWRWVNRVDPELDTNTLVSVEKGNNHYFTLETDFSTGANLTTYANKKTEPRLRPTVKGELEFGDQIGTILLRGVEHPVYSKIKTFDEGGVVEDQMEMMFKSSRTDPVSGNEVPLGSKPEEVRDDIPAMLSEGEYVVPADVVRYYGVKFFEDLRTDAKMGLQEMAANGRIGGEPIDEPQGQELSDEEFLMIVGNVMNEPQEMNEGGSVRGFAPGGLNPALGYDSFTPDFKQAPGLGQFSQSPLAQQYLVPGAMTLGAATGTPPPAVEASALAPDPETTAPTPSPQYCSNIGMQYDSATKTCVPIQTSDDNDGPKPPETEPRNWYDGIDWNDSGDMVDSLTGDPSLIQKGASAIAGAALGPIGMAAGPIMQVSNLANAHAMANIYQAMGNDDLASQIRGKIDARLEESSITKGAYNAIDSVFGADGDRKTMQILEEAGVDLSSLKGKRGKELTAAMDEFLGGMSQADKRKVRIFTKYQAPEPILKAETEKVEKQAAAAVDNYAALVNQPVATSSGSGSNEYNKPIVTQKSIQQTKDIVAKSKDKEDTTKNLERTTSKIKDLTSGKNTSGQVGFNKGGLMKKK